MFGKKVDSAIVCVLNANESRMRGPEEKPIRDALGLDPYQMAMILGVSVSTIYRWETSAGRSGTISGLQADLLTGLKSVLVRAKWDGGDLGQKIKKALAGGGSLAALRVALDAITKEISHA